MDHRRKTSLAGAYRPAKALAKHIVAETMDCERLLTTEHELSAARDALLAAQSRHPGATDHSPPTTAESAETNKRQKAELVSSISLALDGNRLRLALQPIVRSGARQIAFYECLMRLEQLDGALLSAGASIEAAERNGFSCAIDLRSLQMASEILDAAPNLNLSLNVSALTSSNCDWLARLGELVRRQPGFARRLIVEITETAEIKDLNASIQFVNDIKSLGCRVALDDFGSGFTSFEHLTAMPVDIVKIDGSFIQDIANQTTDLEFVRTFVSLAKKLRIETVAEWVANNETAAIVTELGVDYMQGFYFGEPLPLDDILMPVGTTA